MGKFLSRAAMAVTQSDRETRDYDSRLTIQHSTHHASEMEALR